MNDNNIENREENTQNGEWKQDYPPTEPTEPQQGADASGGQSNYTERTTSDGESQGGQQSPPSQSGQSGYGAPPPPQGGYNSNNRFQNYGSRGATPPPPKESQPEYQWSFEDYDKLSQAEAGYKPKNNTGLKVFAVVITIVFVLTVAGFSGVLLYQNRKIKNTDTISSSSDQAALNAPEVTLNNRPPYTDENYTDGVLSTEEIASKVRPSVVGIETYDLGISLMPLGTGSGIIMTGDGYILTNAHVISGATGIAVTLDNEEQYEATLVGIDEQTDIAVIKIDATNLTAAEFGNSDELVVGERIIAIGNPTGLNLAGSTTQGIVSGLKRNITVPKDDGTGDITMEVIQVDAAINPGNSGGALINKYGQVVGINSSKLSSTQIEGIGFAIPMSTAKPIVDDLTKYGYVKGRVRLGITYSAISDVVGAMSGYTPGLLIRSIDETMDIATKAKVGDIITKMDGQDVRDSDTVKAIMKTKKPGETVQLTLVRQSTTGKLSTLVVDVLLAEDKGSYNEKKEQEQQQEQQTPYQLPFNIQP